MTGDNFSLPSLNPFLKIYEAPRDEVSGAPSWTLHNPVANTYFRLNWAEFECLSRFAHHKTAQDILQAIHSETTLDIDANDIRELARFLDDSGLTVLSPDTSPHTIKNQESLWKKILHGYLYFTIPLVHPQRFLDKTLPFVEPFLSRQFTAMMIAIGILASVMTLGRFDEFCATFTGLKSIESIIQIALTFTSIKIIHELGHAYTATKHGVPVPHAGIAFIVLYPVLYTEVTASWQMQSRKKRLEIGFAGIRAELCLAAMALLLWNMSAAGSIVHELTFMVVTVAMVSSLLVNLNPLMRFDGYYMLSDVMGIDNLQSRAIAYARWALRRVVFGWQDEPPEYTRPTTQNFLVTFGFALLIYRFFVFGGIALAVYHLFFMPLGLLLMLAELWLFIVRPMSMELKIWAQRRKEILSHQRGRLSIIVSGIILLACILPIHRTINIPAVAHAKNYAALYAPYPSVITDIFVKEGDVVKKNDVLIVLESALLEQDISVAKARLNQLESLKRRFETDLAFAASEGSAVADKIRTARDKLKALLEQKERLVIVANYDGEIKDLNPYLHSGRLVKVQDLLMRLVDNTATHYTAYVSGEDLEKITSEDSAVFIADAQPLQETEIKITHMATTDADKLDWPELASCYGGLIESECGDGQGRNPAPLQNVYALNFVAKEDSPSKATQVSRGQINIKGAFFSPLLDRAKKIGNMLRREIDML